MHSCSQTDDTISHTAEEKLRKTTQYFRRSLKRRKKYKKTGEDGARYFTKINTGKQRYQHP
jgi:hypothetical protein